MTRSYLNIPSSLDKVAPKAKMEKEKIVRRKRKSKSWKLIFMLVYMVTKKKLQRYIIQLYAYEKERKYIRKVV